MMNFHVDGLNRDKSKEVILKSINAICGEEQGALLDSGRWFHYYGNFLLDTNQWYKFLAKFTIPCILVSGGFIGHALDRGYVTLRLTSDEKHNPKIPTVVDIIN